MPCPSGSANNLVWKTMPARILPAPHFLDSDWVILEPFQFKKLGLRNPWYPKSGNVSLRKESALQNYEIEGPRDRGLPRKK